jgi:aryl-alcohol dehydrogenase
MTITAQAAICRTSSDDFLIETIEIDGPRHDEVLVRVIGVGVCHTDMSMRAQEIPVPQPVVLGHEGSGIVQRVGDSVAGLAVGDRVVLSFNSCGGCRNCNDNAPAYCYQAGLYNFAGIRADGSIPLSCEGQPIHGNIFGQSSFATLALTNARNTVRVPDSAADVPLELLGPLGCGIQTGAGAVLNSLAVTPGSSIAIFGTGAVGLSAVMAAKIAGATTIIAIDLHDSRCQMARELGATHAFNAKEDIDAKLAELCPDGLVYAFDTTGRADVIELAFTRLAVRGTLGLVGACGPEATVRFNEIAFMGGGRTVRGILEGDSRKSSFQS